MFDRRKLITRTAAASVFGLGISQPLFASSTDLQPVRMFGGQSPLPEPEVRKVSLYNLHTLESAEIVYKEKGQIIPDALAQVNLVLRDYRNNEIMQMDVALLDLLDELSRKLETNVPFNVISGYRSPQTNAMLHDRSSGVAKRSLHMEGKAIDIRVPNVALTHLRNVAKEMGRGGVGFYASDNFVHVDTGRVRYW